MANADKEKLTLAQENLDAHPALAEAGLAVGDTIEFPSNGDTAESLAKAVEDATFEKCEADDIHTAEAPKEPGESEDAGERSEKKGEGEEGAE